MVVCIRGALGTGKSVFARALGSALGVRDAMPSPSFTIIHEYLGSRNVPVLHVDLYRITNEEEYHMLALEELMTGAITIVEWPERAGSALRDAHVLITIEPGDKQADEVRTITIELRNAHSGP